MNELILDKIIKQSQFKGLIAKAELRSITLKELVEDMETYYCFTEILWEKLLMENKMAFTNELLVLQQRYEITELKKEIEKLNKVLNDNG